MKLNINVIEDLIGKQCVYHHIIEDDNGYQIMTKHLAKIGGYKIYLEDTFPYNLELTLCIEPVGNHNFEEEDLQDFGINGVSINLITLENYF